MIINIDKIVPFISLGVLLLMWYSIFFYLKVEEMKPFFIFLGIINTIWVVFATLPFLYWL